MSKGSRASREARLKAALATQTTAATDSYNNAPARIGQFTGNLASQGTYPLTRYTQQYMTLLAMYRNHWIVRKVVDCLAEDMLKDAPKLNCELKPEQISKFDKVLRDTATIAKLLEALKWGRLFGGGIALICIDGHEDLSEPLRLEDVDLGSYKGLIALDRWSGVFPGSELETDLSYPRAFGLPKFYECRLANEAAVTVHHTRVIRFTGRALPEWERQVEMYWGLSEIELIFDELQKRDYTSWNIVSLITRAQIISVKDEQLAQSMSGLGKSNEAFNRYLERMDAMAQSMNNQGLLVVGKDGGLESNTYSFGGLADVYETQMADVAGAAEYPVSRLFGARKGGLGDSGEGDLQQYDDLVESKRFREVNPAMDQLLPVVCMSTFGKVPDDFDYSFPPLRSMTNKERAELAKESSASVIAAYEADLVTKQEARGELAQISGDTGMFSNITDEAVAATPDTYASEAGGGELDIKPGEDEEGEHAKAAVDADIPLLLPDDSSASSSVAALQAHHGLIAGVENVQGSLRRGLFWKTRMPADYGFIVGVTGADGDALDCYIGRTPESDRVFVVDQNRFDGKSFDEHKVMLGYSNPGEAVADYMAGHHKSKRVFRGVTEMSMPQFKQWMKSADLTLPCGT
jgi:phage-related protein (TIGR01555 family)